MATPAHEFISTTTTSSSTSQVTFSSIPATFRDFVMVIDGETTSINNGYYRLNNDSSFDYDVINIEANASVESSRSNTSANRAYLSFDANVWDTNDVISIITICDYADTDKQKVGFSDTRNAGRAVNKTCNLWKNTSAVNRIDIFADFATGVKFDLYGVYGEVV